MLRRFLILALLFLTLAPVSVFAQNILPGRFAGWQGTPADPASGASMEQFALKAAPVLREYGITSAEQVSYSKDKSNLVVTLYHAKDATGAYGAYSYLRTSDMPHANFSAHSSMSRDHALVLIGDLLLDISGNDLRTVQPGLRTLVAQVQTKAGPEAYPSLYKYLPTDGIIQRSDRYVLGPVGLSQFLPIATDDWIGFSSGAEVELARYRIKGQEETLLLAEYPTPQVASLQMKNLEKRFRLVGDADEPAAQSGDSRPLLYYRKMSTLLVFVPDGHSKASADLLLQNIAYESDVTWNEPGANLNQPGWPTILVGIFVGTGILCLFAIVSSLAFGGFRLAVKRLLPGKIFDRDADIEILQLGISSKPIEAKDFY
jgi:hypothetical protein